MMTIDSSRIHAIFLDCLYDRDELDEDETPLPVLVEGLTARFGLHPERLESHRAEVAGMLAQLPDEFRSDGGGGWSFLNACNTRDGEQWTGLHQNMQELFVLGVGLGLASYLMPRAMWGSLPGGMPYIVIDSGRIAEAAASPLPA